MAIVRGCRLWEGSNSAASSDGTSVLLCLLAADPVPDCGPASFGTFRFARIRSLLCGFEAWRLFPSVPFLWTERVGKASKKAAMMRFAPTAPQRLCARTKCLASGGKGLVSRRDAEAQRRAGPRTGGFFCVSLRFLRPSVPPVIEASKSHSEPRRREGGQWAGSGVVGLRVVGGLRGWSAARAAQDRGGVWGRPPFQGSGRCRARRPRALPLAALVCPVGAWRRSGALRVGLGGGHNRDAVGYRVWIEPRVGLVPRPTLGSGTQRRWRWEGGNPAAGPPAFHLGERG